MPKLKVDPNDSTNPVNPKIRKYACSRWPSLSCGGGLKFENGYLIAEGEEKIARVERTDAFKHGQIVRILGKKQKEVSIEEATEVAAIEQLTQLAPRVRRGAISTNSFSE